VEALNVRPTAAETSDIMEMRNFAQIPRRDYEPMKAALSSSWSNAQTEGHVNRLKMIERTMYRRAGYKLLARRILHAP
jgi:transposase